MTTDDQLTSLIKETTNYSGTTTFVKKIIINAAASNQYYDEICQCQKK